MNVRQKLIWARLSTRSRRALLKTTKKWGHRYRYKPRGDLLQNLAEEFDLTIEQAARELYAIRQYYIKRSHN